MSNRMSRSLLREHAFRILFEAAFYDPNSLSGQADLYFQHAADDPEDEGMTLRQTAFTEADKECIREKVINAAVHIPQIDEKINAVSKGWPTDRLGTAELTILRLGISEMLYDPDIPVGVAIDEAVELAKKYGQSSSPALVNGIMSKLKPAQES
ncbi:MAG: transcription antitermination factor NusB [Lachnospira sp.]|nr:transcription antitermination factor NusB [Lachnospira sp.]